jgi:hypothetical protein
VSSAWFLASWAKLPSWQEVAQCFQTSWESVFCSVEMAAIWGRARIDLTGITALGVDEIYWKSSKFLTLVYQINEGMKPLLFVVEDREENSLRQFFVWLGAERSALIEFVFRLTNFGSDLRIEIDTDGICALRCRLGVKTVDNTRQDASNKRLIQSGLRVHHGALRECHELPDCTARGESDVT